MTQRDIAYASSSRRIPRTASDRVRSCLIECPRKSDNPCKKGRTPSPTSWTRCSGGGARERRTA